MKVAAGCFGCLALVFFAVLAGGVAIPYVIDAGEGGLGAVLRTQAGIMQMVGGSCCCLSSLAFVVFAALGMRGGNPEAEE
jgi:hypothetical protein